MFAFAVVQWQIDPREALVAYLWSWLENQVMAALKAVPLGQTDGQKMLFALGATLPAMVGRDSVEPKSPAAGGTSRERDSRFDPFD